MQLQIGNLTWATEVYWTRDLLRRTHEANEAFNEIVDEAKGTRLSAFAENGKVTAEQRLDYEAGYDAPIVRVGSRPYVLNIRATLIAIRCWRR